MTSMRTLLLVAAVALSSGAWRAGSPARPSRPQISLTRPASAATPIVAQHRTAQPWLSTGLTYLGLGSVTAGLGYAATAVAGPAAGLALGVSVALPVAVSLVELYLFGGPRIAKLMGGKPADAELQAMVAEVAQRASLPMPAHVFEIDTHEMNAFAAGLFARDRTVAVTKGLRRKLSERELKAVIAHEMGHLRHSDVSRNMHLAAAAAGLGGIYQGGRYLLRSSSTKKSSKDKDGDSGSAAMLGLGMMAAGVVTQCASHLMRLGLSRKAEFAADAVAAELYGAEAIASALQKIAQPGQKRDKLGARGNAFAHMYIAPEPTSAASARAPAQRGAQRPWWRNWHRLLSTHPSTEDRIEALQHLRQQ